MLELVRSLAEEPASEEGEVALGGRLHRGRLLVMNLPRTESELSIRTLVCSCSEVGVKRQAMGWSGLSRIMIRPGAVGPKTCMHVRV